jgi:putative ABC transport system substrate-binding protein
MQFDQLRRRDFVTLLGGAVAWPIGAYAQVGTRMRRVGAMMLLAEDDPQQKAWTEAFLLGLQEAGWTDRSDIQIEYRWRAGDAARARRYAAELVSRRRRTEEKIISNCPQGGRGPGGPPKCRL